MGLEKKVASRCTTTYSLSQNTNKQSNYFYLLLPLLQFYLYFYELLVSECPRGSVGCVAAGVGDSGVGSELSSALVCTQLSEGKVS